MIHRSAGLMKADTGRNLLSLQKPDWHGYINLKNAIAGFRSQWGDYGSNSQTSKGIKYNEDIQAEFDRQISEIKRIFNSEENLKLNGLDQAFQEYAKKRRQTLDDIFKKKSTQINEILLREILQKETGVAQQIQRYQTDLEYEQRLNLVNLQLQLAIADLKGAANEIDSIQTKIAAIKNDITQKVAAKKDQLNNQFIVFEKQKNDDARTELDNLKTAMESELKNDLAAYRAKLTSEFKDWSQNQAREFDKAIQIRQKQKKL